MIDILVTFNNAEFLRTKMNCTFEEAYQYYTGNSFTFGSSEENEQQITGVNVTLYDQWKHQVLKYSLENNNTVLNFDDDNEEVFFRTMENDYEIVPYSQIENNMLQYT